MRMPKVPRKRGKGETIRGNEPGYPFSLRSDASYYSLRPSGTFLKNF